MKIFDVIVLGGGPAGYTAALYCARANLKTMILEKMWPGGQMATTSQVDNYPGFNEGIDGHELSERMKLGAERFGVVSEYGEVISIEATGQPKRIKTNSAEYECKALIIATGAAPRSLNLPHEEELRGRGVAYCATCDGLFFKNKVVAVVGGGNSAVADALYLSKICKKVYLIHRRNRLNATKTYLAPLDETENIEFIWNSQVVEPIYGDVLTGIKLENTETGAVSQLDCDGLFIAIGRRPNTDLFEGIVDIDEAGYIIADETTQTNVEGVYAVGDVRTKPLRQIITAASDGAVASKFIEDYFVQLCGRNHKAKSLRYKSEPNRFFVQTPENYEVGELNLEPTTDNTFIITHVGVDNSYNGLGLAKELVRQTVEAARQNHWKLIPRCPFAKVEYDKHPEYKDTLA